MGIDQSYGEQFYYLTHLAGLRFHEVPVEITSVNIDLYLIMYEYIIATTRPD